MKALRDLTQLDVLAAAVECDELGREVWLAKHGYRPSLKYKVLVGRKLYDSKAIVGVALGKSASDFSGGAATVQRRLQALGFAVRVAS